MFSHGVAVAPAGCIAVGLIPPSKLNGVRECVTWAWLVRQLVCQILQQNEGIGSFPGRLDWEARHLRCEVLVSNRGKEPERVSFDRTANVDVRIVVPPDPRGAPDALPALILVNVIRLKCLVAEVDLRGPSELVASRFEHRGHLKARVGHRCVIRRCAKPHFIKGAVVEVQACDTPVGSVDAVQLNATLEVLWAELSISETDRLGPDSRTTDVGYPHHGRREQADNGHEIACIGKRFSISLERCSGQWCSACR